MLFFLCFILDINLLTPHDATWRHQLLDNKKYMIFALQGSFCYSRVEFTWIYGNQTKIAAFFSKHLFDRLCVVSKKPNGTKSEILVLFLWIMTKQLYFKFYVDIFGKLMSIKMQKEVSTLLVMMSYQWCHMTSLHKIVHISVENLKPLCCLLVFHNF